MTPRARVLFAVALVLFVACNRARPTVAPAASAFVPCAIPELKSREAIPYCALAVRPSFDTAGARPKTADILQSAGIATTVRIALVLDSAGHPIPSRSRVLPANPASEFPSHALSDATVMRRLTEYRFTAGRTNAGAAETALVLEVDFPGVGRDSVPTRPAYRQESHPWGIRVVVGDEPIPRARNVSGYSKATTTEIQRAVIAAALPYARTDSGRAVCVGIRQRNWTRRENEDPSPQLLQQLRDSRFVPASNCPPTYAQGMIANLDSLGRPILVVRPPGALDPGAISIQRVEPWTADVALVHVTTGVGHGYSLLCSAFRSEADRAVWTASCAERGSWVA